LAVASISYSRLPAPSDEAEANCINKRFYQFNLAELVKYVISALGFNPNTIGELIRGISLTVLRKDYKLLAGGRA
jgi:hypothetical protein